MDRSKQFARTDRDITAAVLRLMDRMPFEKITVGDIVEEAMINRSTFYLHFQDKYAVMERLEGDYLRQLSDLFEELEAGDSGLRAMDRVLHGYFLRNREVLRQLIKTEPFRQKIRSLMCEYMQQRLPGVPESELQMIAAIVSSFLFYVMEHPEAEGSFSTMFMENYLNITMRFFRLDRLPDGRKRLMELIGEANRPGRGEHPEASS